MLIRHFLWAIEWEEANGRPLSDLSFRRAFFLRNVTADKEFFNRVFHNPFYRFEGFLVNDLLGIQFPYGRSIGVLINV
jgi:hypothetical protein